MTNQRSRRKQHPNSLPLALALGLGMGILLSLLMIAIGAAVAYKSADPGKLILPISLICLGVCSIFVGFASAKLYGRRHPTTGLLAGLGWALLLLAGSFALPASGGSPLRYLCYPVTVALSFGGGLVACRDAGSKKRRRR